jgi:hypothetical protein
MSDLCGQIIRGYEIRAPVGAGGFGAVYRAYQPSVQREVAVKIILPQYANQPEFIRRFETEAHLVARLEHPHIVPLYDYWREPDGAYLVMRWLRGGSLRAALARGPWPVEAVARLLDQVAGALSVAHRQSIVHRDIKPDNILLDEDGHAYLTDFGIAKDIARSAGLTGEDVIAGSLAYIAPEQAQAQPVSPQTDIYSLGVTMYELLAGEHPFAHLSPTEQLLKHISEPLPCLHDKRPELPAALDDVIQRATAKDPGERFPQVSVLAAAFRTALETGAPIAPAEPIVIDLAAPLDAPNPYKGLRAFQAADALDFFGRESLTQRLLARLGEKDNAARFLAVVGPSGCGKSSVVGAGLVPALWRGALPGSDQWFVVEMLPGAHPLEELEIGLLRIAARHPAGLMEQLRRDERGLLRAARLALPSDDSVLLLIIDQFEEIFTHAKTETAHLLNLLLAAATDPRSPLRIVVTLRADFYDRPLMYPDFGELMRQRTEVVVPLTTDELERAITGPAERVGAVLEQGLVTAIIADVNEQPGALPLLQYALTELYVRREGHLLTRRAYESIGGVLGALGRRAEEVYAELDADNQAAFRVDFPHPPTPSPNPSAPSTLLGTSSLRASLGRGGRGRGHNGRRH